MAQKENDPDQIERVNTILSSSEQWVEKNQKLLLGLIAAAIIVAAGILAFSHFYSAPRAEKAQAELFKGEFYFAVDSFKVALDGDEAGYIGFKAIADIYSSTEAGNLANAYAGISLYNLGEYDEAISYLEDYSGKGTLLEPNILEMIGNCYANKADFDKAIKYFADAAKVADSEVVSPIFLKKAGVAAEAAGKFDEAAKYYQEIKDKYPASSYSRDIEKYVERAKASK